MSQSSLSEKPSTCHQLYFLVGLGVVLTSQGAQVRFLHLSPVGSSCRRNWLSFPPHGCHTHRKLEPPCAHLKNDSGSVRARVCAWGRAVTHSKDFPSGTCFLAVESWTVRWCCGLPSSLCFGAQSPSGALPGWLCIAPCVGLVASHWGDAGTPVELPGTGSASAPGQEQMPGGDAVRRHRHQGAVGD